MNSDRCTVTTRLTVPSSQLNKKFDKSLQRRAEDESEWVLGSGEVVRAGLLNLASFRAFQDDALQGLETKQS